MKEYLNSAKKRFFLTLGKYTFSPILQSSVALALDYSEDLKNGGKKEPLTISFPSKGGSAALWISVQYLINLFFENYFYQSENRIKELGLKRGDKIDIFSTTAIFQGIDNKTGKLIISFADGVLAFSAFRNSQFINLARKNMVNNYKHYCKKKESFINKRKALTLILGLDLNPNFEALHSKVILISGRGKAGLFKNILKELIVYDESLADTILLDKNLLIFPDFNCFEGLVSPDLDKNTDFFIKAVQSILQFQIDNDEVTNLKEDILKSIDSSLKTELFVDTYQKLVNLLLETDSFESIGIKLQNLLKYHPGIEQGLLNNLSAVIINEVQFLNEYPETIQYLLNLNIPVIVIGDRVISEFKELDVYKTVFNSEEFKNSYRFIWEQDKIKHLSLEYDDGSKYIDHNINNLALQSSVQKVEIIEFGKNRFDNIFSFFESRTFLDELAEYELLQKGFYQLLRPTLYMIKNSLEGSNGCNYIKHIESFENIFKESSSGLTDSIIYRVQKELCELKSYCLASNQPKEFEASISDLFFQDICIEEDGHTIPYALNSDKVSHYNCINDDLKSITFTGYPYREYYFKHIEGSVFTKILPSVKILLNECESAITKGFLFRKFKFGFFIEKYPDSISHLDNQRIKTTEQIHSKLKQLFIEEKSNNNEEIENIVDEFDGFERMLNDIRYSEYNGSSKYSEENGRYLLNCNVLHCENAKYLFLPHKWKILLLKESHTGVFNSLDCRINDIAVGNIAVVVNVSRKSISKYLEKSGSVSIYLQTLDIWKNILYEEYAKNNDINKLVKNLHHANVENNLSGRPEIYNILRWLHDEMILAPAFENLEMILALKYPKEDIELKAKEILGAKRIILNAKNRLDRAVKDKLSRIITVSNKDLEDNFQIEVEGIQVKVQKAGIIGVEKRKDLLIEYHSTMKFYK